MNAAVLKIDKSGQPLRWISKEQATHLVCNNKVLWSFGDETLEMRGGIGHDGSRSIVYLAPIIAVDGSVKRHASHVPLENRYLFRRDNHRCLYCGNQFSSRDLTRDHVIPVSKGGPNTWMNVVSACRVCNNRKADRTPEQANMPLLAVPFKPTFCEFLYLQNHNILGDQMRYLEKGFRKINRA